MMAEHEKHLQLGANLDDDDRRVMTPEEKAAAIADACTIEEFADQLTALHDQDPLVQWELARARQEAGL
jgi:hypothetical protein